MKFVVVGGTGLIGTKLVASLSAHGHEVLAAARGTGVNSFTGEGLPEALAGADVVIDVSNSSYTDEAGAIDFFDTSTLNLLTHGAAAGVRHHLALSVVGTDRRPDTERGYFRAKFVQEQLIEASQVPYSIVRATQFFEFLPSIADAATTRNPAHVAHTFTQPIAADDVVDAVERTALGDPMNGSIEVAGPERFTLEEAIRRELRATRDPREVVADPRAHFFGDRLGEEDLLPVVGAQIAPTRFDSWLRKQIPVA